MLDPGPPHTLAMVTTAHVVEAKLTEQLLPLTVTVAPVMRCALAALADCETAADGCAGIAAKSTVLVGQWRAWC